MTMSLMDNLPAVLLLQLWNAAWVFALLFPPALLLKHRYPALSAVLCWLMIAVLLIPGSVYQYLPVFKSLPQITHVLRIPTDFLASHTTVPQDALEPHYASSINWAFFLAWGLCASLLLARLLWLRQSGLRVLKQASKRLHNGDTLNLLHKWQKLIGVHKDVHIRTAPNISPCTYGTLRPVILLPEALLQGNQSVQTQAIIAHELAHIQRRDDIQLLALQMLQALFVFFPVIYFCNRLLGECRELLCDQMVLRSAQLQPGEYGRAILSAAQPPTTPGGLLLNAGASRNFKTRLKFIFSQHAKQRLATWKIFVCFSGFAVAIMPWLANSTATGNLNTPTFIAPVKQGRISSHFGIRTSPLGKQSSQQWHKGIDIINAAGTPIRAVAAGIITHVEENHPVAGKLVVIQHNAEWQSTYTHLAHINVQNGNTIKQGQTLGTMGATGRATGPHLHFELLKNSNAQNPLDYFWEHKKATSTQ